MWRKLDESERGIAPWKSNIICDEEYEGLCRMIAEQCEDGNIAVVCSVYGLMTQGVFCEADAFPAFYEAMKKDMEQILRRKESAKERLVSCRAFFDRYASLEPYRRKMNERSIVGE